MSLSKTQCRNLVYQYFLVEGWLPPGTTAQTWRQVAMRDLGMDDPPLPSDPHLQKRQIAHDLQKFFHVLGGNVASPLAQLKKPTLELQGLADWCLQNQGRG